MSEMLPDENAVQRSWVDRWVNIEPPPPIASRWVDIAQVTPPPEPNPGPTVVPRGLRLVLVFVVLAMAALAIVEVLLRFARAGN